MNNLLNYWGRFRLWTAKQNARDLAQSLIIDAQSLTYILRKYDVEAVTGGTKTFQAVKNSLQFGAVKRAEKRLTEELMTDVVDYADKLERRLSKSPYAGLNVGGSYHA